MNTYTTKTTDQGDQTYLFDGEATCAVFTGPNHAKDAACAAEMFNARCPECGRVGEHEDSCQDAIDTVTVVEGAGQELP